jgi:hypothetical protein
MAQNLQEGSVGWAIVMAVCVLYWVRVAYKAINGKKDLVKEAVTQEQIDLLKDCYREMGRIIARKELELLAINTAKENNKREVDDD